MYQFTQKHNKLILIVVCVVLLPFVGFSFYPIMNRISGNQALDEAVGTFEVPVGHVHAIQVDEWRATSRRLSRIGRVMRIVQVRDEDDIWLHLTQVAEAEALGIRISDDQLNEFITDIRKSIGAQKLERYQTFVKEQVGLSLKEFERTLREVLMRNELQSLYMTTDNVGWDALHEQYQEENRKVTIRAVKFDTDQIRASLKPIDFPLKPKLEEFYNNPNTRFLLESRTELMLPRVFEEVKVVYGSYDEFNPEQPEVKALLENYKPTELEINQEYERWKYSLYRNKPEPAKPETPKKPEKPAENKEPDAGKAPEDGGKKAAPQDAPEAKPEAKPAPPPFKPLAEVRGDVVKRLQLREAVKRVRAEAEKMIQAAREAADARKAEEKKAGKDANQDQPKKPGQAATPPGQKPDDTKKEPVKPAPVPTVDLEGLARKYGLHYQKLGPETVETIKKCKPFDEDVPRRLPVLVMELQAGKLSKVVDDTQKLVYFARLIQDRPEKLKPLADIEDEVREVVMDQAAKEKTREEAQAFYDGLKEKVMEELKPVLDKEVREPLRKRKEEEIAKENAQRNAQGRPPLSAEELKVIDQRFEELQKKQELPRIDEVLAEKRGQFFDLLAREKKLKPEEYAFHVLTADWRDRRGSTAFRGEVEKELKPDLWFIKNRSGISTELRKVGDVSRPQPDGDRAIFVLKLVNTEPPEWKRMDPRTFESLMSDAKRGLMYREQSGVGRLGARQLENRYDLKTKLRPQPETGPEQAPGQGRPVPLRPQTPGTPNVPAAPPMTPVR